jgi:hypothetical protein
MKDDLLDAKESALRSYNRFLSYFNRALQNIENAGYMDGMDILSKLPEQAKEEIFGATKDKNYYSLIEGFSRNIKDKSLASRVFFISRVVDYLDKKSQEGKYHPSNGSFWEAMGQTLEKLASDVKKEGLF